MNRLWTCLSSGSRSLPDTGISLAEAAVMLSPAASWDIGPRVSSSRRGVLFFVLPRHLWFSFEMVPESTFLRTGPLPSHHTGPS